MQLQESLETTEQRQGWLRWAFDPTAWLHQVRFAPALAAAIFIVGFAGGIGATYKMVKAPIEILPGATPAPVSQASISGIQSVPQQPGSDKVTANDDTVAPHGA